MSILYSSGNKPFKHPNRYDADEKKYYSVSYRPKTRIDSTEYTKGKDIIILSTPNGLMYECVSGGISAATAPTFSTLEEAETADGEASWKGKAYNLLLDTGDAITTSTWTGTNGETVDNESIVGGIQTKFRLTAVPSGATSATIVNHITVTRANSDVEELDRSIVIMVKTL